MNTTSNEADPDSLSIRIGEIETMSVKFWSCRSRPWTTDSVLDSPSNKNVTVKVGCPRGGIDVAATVLLAVPSDGVDIGLVGAGVGEAAGTGVVAATVVVVATVVLVATGVGVLAPQWSDAPPVHTG